MRDRTIARAHGTFNIVGGVWPLVHRRSFEAVFGAKHDRWLMRTVAGLLVGNGVVQCLAADTPDGVRCARQLGLTTASWLLVIDLVYAPPGRIPRTYLLDAAMEIGWITAWLQPSTRGTSNRSLPRLRLVRDGSVAEASQDRDPRTGLFTLYPKELRDNGFRRKFGMGGGT
ncbi:hypothetical protein [Nocardia stercoris]|uniref:hypothetical protein n=1 Tax=Nocardia stercoris TaxID=2483361 RepID=UPI0018F45311|nr:hypothetical protein [Nocardia stercoris]